MDSLLKEFDDIFDILCSEATENEIKSKFGLQTIKALDHLFLIFENRMKTFGEINLSLEEMTELIQQIKEPKLESISRIIGNKCDLSIKKEPKEELEEEDNSFDISVNDYCRAVWNEDGYEYEAIVVSINKEMQTCLVRYLGYNNVEVKRLDDLLPSEGEKSRQRQIKDAEYEEATLKQTQESVAIEVPETNLQSHAIASNQAEPNLKQMKTEKDNKVSTKKESKSSNKNETGKLHVGSDLIDSCSFVPLPPKELLQTITDHETSDDLLSSMLMSWYICGYHTGRYLESQKHKTKSSL